MMPAQPTLSVIIVTYNSGTFLPACLESLSRPLPAFGIEVIAVDNASTDDSIALIRRHSPGAQIISNPANSGFAAANNMAFRRSTGEFILLLNPDTIVGEGALEQLAGFLREHRDAGAAGPRILNPDGTLQQTGVSAPSLWNALAETFFLDAAFPRSTLFGRHRRLYDDPGVSREVDCLQGSCLIVRREAIRGTLFDESYFLYFEETDLCSRLRSEGWKVLYVPDAPVVHFGGSGAGYYDRRRIVLFHQSYLVYLQKHFGAVRRMLFRLVLLIRASLRAVLFVAGALFMPGRRAELLDRGEGYLDTIRLLAGLSR